jgi:dihydroorotase
MNSYLLKDGHVVDPANNIDKVFDIRIENGKIKELGTLEKNNNEKIIDCKNLHIFPGFVDLQVHLREPGREDKETIESGLTSALHGGITSVLSMPNTNPTTDSASMVEYQINRAKSLNLANLYVAGSITKGQKGKKMSEFWEMKNSGIVALTDDGVDVEDEMVLQKSMEYALTHNLPILSHCQNYKLTDDGIIHEGKISTKLALAGISTEAEDMAVYKNLLLAKKTGCKLHLLHNSTKGSVKLIKEFIDKGVNITAETCPQYISLTDEICDNYNTQSKMYPPIRSKDHQDAIIKALQDDIITVISTDHAPHLSFEKEQSFENAAFGSVGLESSFSICYTYLVKNKKLSLSKLVEKMTVNPAKVININKGTLSIGRYADISVFDLNTEWEINVKNMKTKGGNCVFNGMKVFSKPKFVFVKGEEKIN